MELRLQTDGLQVDVGEKEYKLINMGTVEGNSTQ